MAHLQMLHKQLHFRPALRKGAVFNCLVHARRCALAERVVGAPQATFQKEVQLLRACSTTTSWASRPLPTRRDSSS